MPIKRNRANSIPAKSSFRMTVGEQVTHMVDKGFVVNKKTKRLSYRKMIQDTCDYCFKYVYMYRYQMALRLKGRTFMCVECREDPKLADIVATKPGPLPCFNSNE